MGTVQLVGAAVILSIMSSKRDTYRTQQRDHSNQLATARSARTARQPTPAAAVDQQ